MRNSISRTLVGSLVLANAGIGCAHHRDRVVYKDRVVYQPARVVMAAPPPASASPVPDPAGDPSGTPAATPTEATPEQSAAPSFETDLAPYGSWVQTPEYGMVWMPHGVAADWQPYTLGHWAYVDEYGWMWMSDEPFGWATYHYGRWGYLRNRGWAWVPGREWAPAWVAWRSGGGYIGWAPLHPGSGRDLHFDIGAIRPEHFHFVDEHHITDEHVLSHAVPLQRNTTIINTTTNVTNYTRVNNRIVNQSINVKHVEDVTGHPVRHYSAANAGAASNNETRGNQVAIRRANIQQSPTTPSRAAEESREGKGRTVEERQAAEDADMNARHARELQNSPPAQRQAVEARHEQERSTMSEHHRQEKKGEEDRAAR